MSTPQYTVLLDTRLWCPHSMACSIRKPLFPLQQSSYGDRDGAPALMPERCSQQLANVNLPDTHSRVGASRQQQFSTACEWDWRAICWPKSLIISTSLSVGVGTWGASRLRREEIIGSREWHQMSSCWHWEVRRQWGWEGQLNKRTTEQIHCMVVRREYRPCLHMRSNGRLYLACGSSDVPC